MEAPSRAGAVWQPEEDELLACWQAKVGNRWSVVAKHIPGRTGQQCAQRWRHKVNPDISHRPWTAEEDALLLSLVESQGQHWAAIARQLPGRTDQQCLGRWRRRLDPSVCRGEWTAEEDELLLQLHAQLGNSWSQIARRVTARTSQQCRGRYFQLQSKNDRPSKQRAAARGKRASGHKQGSCSEEFDEFNPADCEDNEDLPPFRSLQNTAWHDEMAEADDEQDEPAPRAASLANRKATKPEQGSFSCIKQERMPDGLAGLEGWVDMQQATTIQLPHKQSASHLASTLHQNGTGLVSGRVPVQPAHSSGVKLRGPMQQGGVTPSQPSDWTLPVPGVLRKVASTVRQVLGDHFEDNLDPQLDAEATAIRRAPATAIARMRPPNARRPKCTPVMLRMMSARTPQGASPPSAGRTLVPPLPLPALNFGKSQSRVGREPSQAYGDHGELPSLTGRSRGTDHEGWVTDRDVSGSLYASCNMKRKSMEAPLNSTLPLDQLPPSCSTATLFTPRSVKQELGACLTSPPPPSNRSAARARTSYKDPTWSQEQAPLEEPLWTGEGGNHGTPDSIVRILQSPDVGATRGLFSPMPQLSGQPMRTPRPRANSPVPMAPLEPAHAEPTPAAKADAGLCNSAECTPDLKSSPTERAGPAQGVASGAQSPHEPCISNWSTVPALSWTSFQQARELHRLQQATISSGACWHGDEPTPVSNHTQSAFAQHHAGSDGARAAGLPCKHLHLHPSYDDPQHAGSDLSSPVAPARKPSGWPVIGTNGSVQRAPPSAPGTDGGASTAGGSSLRAHDLADLSGDDNAPPTIGSGSAGHLPRRGSSQGSKSATPLGRHASQPLVWGNPTVMGATNAAGSQSCVKPSASVAGLAWPKPLQPTPRAVSMDQASAEVMADTTNVAAEAPTPTPGAAAVPKLDAHVQASKVKAWLNMDSAAVGTPVGKQGTSVITASERPPASTNFAAGPGAHISKLKASPSKKLRIEDRSSSPFVTSQGDAARQPSSPSQPAASKKATSPLHARSYSTGDTGGVTLAQRLSAFTASRGVPAAAGMPGAGCSHSDDEKAAVGVPPSLLPRRAMPGYPGFGPARAAQCQSLLAGFKPQPAGHSQPNLADLATAAACESPAPEVRDPSLRAWPASDSNLAARAGMLRKVLSEPTDVTLPCQDGIAPEAQGSAVKPGLHSHQQTPHTKPAFPVNHAASAIRTHRSAETTQPRTLPGMVPVPMQGLTQQQTADAATFLSPAARPQQPAMRVPCLPSSLPSFPLRPDPPAASILSLASQNSLQANPARTVLGWPTGPSGCVPAARPQADQLSVAGCQEPAAATSTVKNKPHATPISNVSAAVRSPTPVRPAACQSPQQRFMRSPKAKPRSETDAADAGLPARSTQRTRPAQLLPVPLPNLDGAGATGKQAPAVLPELTPYLRMPGSAGTNDAGLVNDMMDLGSSQDGNGSRDLAQLVGQVTASQPPGGLVDGERLQAGQSIDSDCLMRSLGEGLMLAGASIDMLHRGTTMSTDLDFFALGPDVGPT